MAEKPNILIAVPAYRGQIRSQCTLSLMHLARAFAQVGASFSPLTTDASSIEDARNYLASRAIADDAHSHLLFVDDDMQFRPQAVLRMLAAAKPIIGCAAPRRSGTPTPRFNIELDLGETETSVADGICRVSRVGTGIMLIDRNVLERLRSTGALRTQEKHGFKSVFDAPIYGFFDRIVTADSRIGEDYSFCNRWRDLCGGEVFALIDEMIGHIGEFNFKASYVEHAKIKV